MRSNYFLEKLLLSTFAFITVVWVFFIVVELTNIKRNLDEINKAYQIIFQEQKERNNESTM